MQKWFDTLFDIRRGEIKRSLLMFLYAFFLLSAYLILKPVRNSLFLTKFGPEQLVFMYMIIAVVAGGVASAYGWFAQRLPLIKLIGYSTLFIILNLAIFWWLMLKDVFGLVYVFYIWVSLFGVITTSQFWLLANHLFDAREAKRLFPFIGAGAIAGGLAGSKTTSLLAGALGTENLLWVCIGLMLLCLGLLVLAWPQRRGETGLRRRGTSTEVGNLWSLLSTSRHLKLLAGIVAVTVIVSTFIDFQFNTIIARSFDQRDELTAFLGDFFFYLSLASLALQFLFSSRILRRFGVGMAIMVLPISLLLGSAAIFVFPTLASAIFLKMSDGGFRYSVNKAGMELLYLPIPTAIKDRVKTLLDVVGDRFSRGVGGGMLFVVQYLLKWPVEYVAVLSAALISVWVYLAVLIRREYTRSFRSALELRTLDSDQIKVQLRDSASLEILTSALQSEEPRQLRFVLELTAQVPDRKLRTSLAQLLEHEDAGVRREAMVQLVALGSRDDTEWVLQYVSDPDPDIRQEALRFLAEHDPAACEKSVQRLMATDDPGMEVSAVRCVLEHGRRDRAGDLDVRSAIERLLTGRDEAGVAALRNLARAFAQMDSDDPDADLLGRFLAHEDPDVVRSALASAGQVARREWTPTIIDRLGHHAYRETASNALAAYGPRVLGTLRDYMTDAVVAIEVRRAIPRAISRIVTTEALTTLEANQDVDDLELRYHIVRSMNRLCNADPSLKPDVSLARAGFETEAKRCYVLCLRRTAVSRSNGDRAAALFIRALDERFRLHLEMAFRFAGLIYDPRDMLYAYTALAEGQAAAMASAVEFLDTLWQRREKDLLFPLLEREQTDRLISAAHRLFSLEQSDANGVLLQVVQEADDWLAACAVYLAHQRGFTELRDACRPLAKHPYPALREATQSALEDWG